MSSGSLPGMDQLIELGLQGPGVVMLGALDGQRHQPGRDGASVERLAIEKEPGQSIDGNDPEGPRPP